LRQAKEPQKAADGFDGPQITQMNADCYLRVEGFFEMKFPKFFVDTYVFEIHPGGICVFCVHPRPTNPAQ